MMTLIEAADSIGATVGGHGPRAPRFTSVSTDSRNLETGALFVALRGERFDGHDYVLGAVESGAAAAMIDAESDMAGRYPSLPLLVVPDTKRALGALAKSWRARFELPLIAVCGSNGKTSVKEMIAGILRAQFGDRAVLSTLGNLNNDIGLPLTLLRLREHHRAAVVELGMNHRGETAYLASITRATIGLVNNAQREHQEFMTSVRDVAEEHGALFASLPADGVAVINADDEYAKLWRDTARAHGVGNVRDFGLGRAAVRASYRLTDKGAELEIKLPEGATKTTLRIPGVHNVRNALAAAAATSAAGASLDAIRTGLARFAAVKGRLQIKLGRHGARVIDDTYNANPDSMRAAIDVLAEAQGLKVLVLGDMGEVGAQGPAFHAEIGKYALERGIDTVLAVGSMTLATVRAFGANGDHFGDADALIVRAQALLHRHPTVLVKGSRFMRMERVVEQLIEGAA